jgi:FAD:protein FMN transferase
LERETYLMGTLLRIGVEAQDRPAGIQAIEDAFLAVRRVDSLLSTWRDDSEIARLNRAPVGVPVSLSAELFAALDHARQWRQETAGAFDPAIGALVDAWDLRGTGRKPTPPALARARAATGMQHFAFSATQRTVRRTDASAWLDTGGFGKGLALREARRALRSAGITAALLNFGGQVAAIGSGNGEGWIIPVAHPSRRHDPVARIRLPGGSASTSAQSQRFVSVGGERVGHVLDPRTGQPVPAWGSVTVVAEDPVVADVVSTALLVLGPDHGLQWARNRPDIGALFLIDREGRLIRRWNPALEKFLVFDCPPNGETKCAGQ